MFGCKKERISLDTIIGFQKTDNVIIKKEVKKELTVGDNTRNLLTTNIKFKEIPEKKKLSKVDHQSKNKSKPCGSDILWIGE